MADGIVSQIVGIPAPIDGNYEVLVKASFIFQGSSGGDWGSSFISKLFKTQNGVTVFGDEVRHSTQRLPFMLQHVFPLTAGFTADVGLFCDINGAVSCTYYDIKVEALVRAR